DPRPGTALVLVAMALTTYLHPKWQPFPRGPGRWLPLADDEAFARAPRDAHAWLDASTRGGALGLVLLLAACAVVARFMWPISHYDAYIVLFDSVVFVPLLGSGRRADLPPDPLGGSAPRLAAIARALRKLPSVRVIASGRLPDQCQEFDELRLLAM